MHAQYQDTRLDRFKAHVSSIVRKKKAGCSGLRTVLFVFLPGVLRAMLLTEEEEEEAESLTMVKASS